MNETLATMEESVETLKREMNDIQQYSRRNSVRVFGIPETANEVTDVLVIDAVTKHLNCPLSVDDIDRSHRSGKPRASSGPGNNIPKPRPILVKFCSYRKKAQIMKVKRKLKNTGLSIHEDLTTKNYDLLMKASKNSKVVAAWSVDGRIIASLKTNRDGHTVKKVITSATQLETL